MRRKILTSRSIRVFTITIVFSLGSNLIQAQNTLWKSYNSAGIKAYQEEDYVNAERLFLEAFDEAERASAGVDVKSNCYRNLATLYFVQKKYLKAEPYYRDGIQFYWLKQLGHKHPFLAQAYKDLGTIYHILSEKSDSKIERANLLQLAEANYQHVLKLLEENLGMEHPAVADTLSALSELKYKQGHLAESEMLDRQALAIRRKALNPKDPRIADSYQSLGNKNYEQGFYLECIPFFQRALSIREESLKEGSPEIAESVTGLAKANYRLRKYKEAEPLFKRALALWEKHPDREVELGEVLTDMGLLYADIDGAETAAELLRRAFSIRQRALGVDHPAVASIMNNLATIYHNQGLFDDAERNYTSAIRIWEESKDPNVTSARSNLATLYFEQGNYLKAQPLLESVLRETQKQAAVDLGSLSSSFNNLALLYSRQGFYEGAEPYFKRALSLREEVLGEEHPDVASTLDNLGTLYFATGRYELAEPLFERALKIRKKVYGDTHRLVAATENNLGQLYLIAGRLSKAWDAQNEALKTWRITVGEEHPDFATGLNNLGSLFQRARKYEKAEEYFRSSLKLREATLDENHPDLASSKNNLAMLLLETGKIEEAKPLLEGALASRKKVFGKLHPQVAATFHNLGLAEYAQALKEPEQARASVVLKEEIPKSENEEEKKKRVHEKAKMVGNPWKNALDFYDKALEIRMAMLGELHPDVASTRHAMGKLYRSWAQVLRDAEIREEGKVKVASILVPKEKGMLSPDDKDDVNTSENRYKSAKNNFERALAVQVNAFGKSHPDVVETLSQIAGVFEDQGRYEAALEVYGQALASGESIGEFEHLYVRHTLDGIVRLNIKAGRYGKGLPLAERSVAITKKAYGPKHPQTADAFVSLADIYSVLGRETDSLALLEQSSEIYNEAFGPEHPKMLSTASRRARLEHRLGDFAAAEELFSKTLKLQQELGKDNPDYIDTLFHWGLLQLDKGELDMAQQAMDEAFLKRGAALGDKDPAIAEVLAGQGMLQVAKKDLEKAENLYTSALAILSEAPGMEERPDYAQVTRRLGTVYARQKNYEKADVTLTKSLAMQRKVYGTIHPDIADNLFELAKVRDAQRTVELGKEQKTEEKTVQSTDGAAPKTPTTTGVAAPGELKKPDAGKTFTEENETETDEEGKKKKKPLDPIHLLYMEALKAQIQATGLLHPRTREFMLAANKKEETEELKRILGENAERRKYAEGARELDAIKEELQIQLENLVKTMFAELDQPDEKSKE